MSRKTIALSQIIDELPEAKSIQEVYRPSPHSYVSFECDSSPIAGLLWREIRRIPHRAKLTDWEEVVFDLFCRGLTDADIGRIFVNPDTGRPRTRQTIREIRMSAFKKIRCLPHLGCLTVMIEELGWPGVREYLADMFERNEHQSYTLSRSSI